jgi:hypothetical protein
LLLYLLVFKLILLIFGLIFGFKTKDKNYIIRNPINNTVYDKEAQKRLDDIEREKKRRYIL